MESATNIQFLLNSFCVTYPLGIPVSVAYLRFESIRINSKYDKEMYSQVFGYTNRYQFNLYQGSTALLWEIPKTKARMDVCAHFPVYPSVFVAIDEIAHKLYVLESNPNYKSLKKFRYLKKRQLQISIYDLTIDPKSFLFSKVSKPSAVYALTKNQEEQIAFCLPIAFGIRQKDGSLYIIFHPCVPSETCADPEDIIIAAMVNFKTNDTFNIQLSSRVHLPPTDDDYLHAVGEKFINYFSSDNRDFLYWPYSYSNMLLFCSVSVKPETFGETRYLRISLDPENLSTNGIDIVLGKTEEFLFFLQRSDQDDDVAAVNAAVNAFFLQRSDQDDDVAAVNVIIYSIRTRMFCPIICRGRDVTQSLRTVFQIYNRRNDTTCYENIWNEEGFKCEQQQCEMRVHKKPKVCRICQRLGAREYLKSNYKALLGGFATSFCSRRCLRDNWETHKALHQLIIDRNR